MATALYLTSNGCSTTITHFNPEARVYPTIFLSKALFLKGEYKNLENYLYFYNKILKKPYIERYAGENVNVNNYLIPQEILLEWLYDFINNDVHLYAIEPSAEASHIGRTVKIK